MTRSRLPARRIARRRSGISLIEIVVACTLLAVTLTSLTGIAARMAARTRTVGYVEQRTATYFEEVNRTESMPYDSLNKYLRTDSVKAGNTYYVWQYTIDPESTSAIGTSKYTKINLTVSPHIIMKMLNGTFSSSPIPVSGVIRRAKPPTYNALNYP